MSIDNYSKKLFDLVNPSGATLYSQVQDIQMKGGYSVHFVVTGTLSFSCTLYGSNDNDNSLQNVQLTSITNSTQTITSTGYLYNMTLANYAFCQAQIGSFTGTGTLKCYFTAKDI